MKNQTIQIYFFLLIISILFLVSDIYSDKNENVKKPEFTQKKIDIKNPHDEIDCKDCHGYKPDRKKETLKTVKFISEDFVVLCLKCHSEESNIHPVNVIPSFDVPKHLPLDKLGRTTCITCHYTHGKTTEYALLRGFADGTYKWRTDICYDCHGNSFAENNPHLTQLGKRKCHFCHSSEPTLADTMKTVSFKVNIFALCDFCHNVIVKQHPLNVDDTITISENLPRDVKGNITCVTCHDPHGTTDTVHYLRTEYVLAQEQDKHINPHFSKEHCTACHLTTPKEGAKEEEVDYKYKGNFIALCNSCHGASANIHPVNVIPSPSMKIPADLPLKDGKITCVTCHDAGFVNRATKYFIRGGDTFEKVNDLCFRCHPKDEFKKINPHFEMKKERKCMYCHIVPPDEKTTAENVTIKGSIKMLCVRCHSDNSHPGKFRHTVRPSMIIPKDFPLDDGIITCSTCHDPHISTKSETVKSKNPRLRKGLQCKLCHVNL